MLKDLGFVLQLVVLAISQQLCQWNQDCPDGAICSTQTALCMFTATSAYSSFAALPNAISIQSDQMVSVTVPPAAQQYLYLTPDSTNVIYFLSVYVCDDDGATNQYITISPMVDLIGTSGVLDGSGLRLISEFEGARRFQCGQGFCGILQQTYISFERGNNGPVERFVLRIKSDSTSQTINFNLKINVLVFVQNSLLMIIGIVMLSAAAAVAFGVIVFCCYRRWKKRKEEEEKMNYKHHMLDHIKKQIPSVLAKNAHLPKAATCSICLCDYSPEQMIRKLVCSHCFHSECIDAWCMKNLNCPVCRFQLDQESIHKKKKENLSANFKWEQNELSIRDDLLQNGNEEVHKNLSVYDKSPNQVL